MAPVNWQQEINFASALLLHSCLTVLAKEACNAIVLLYRLSRSGRGQPEKRTARESLQTSATLDAYTSIFSKDADGELAELYFTNTGALLLCATLASSVVMNLYLSDGVLNGLILGTFCFCFVASLFVGRGRFTIIIVALRRAGRFIWADTPFVNFFALIYIATVLHGSATLRVKDYVAFRSIAVFELLFMKAKLAASSPEQQQDLMRRLIDTEIVVLKAVCITVHTAVHRPRTGLTPAGQIRIIPIGRRPRTLSGESGSVSDLSKAQCHALQDHARPPRGLCIWRRRAM